LDAQVRQVFFFDTPDLALNASGVVVRARRVQKKGDDSVVKLRPVVPSELPARLRRARGFGVEVDAMPGGFVCSASLKGIPGADVAKAAAGKRPLRKLFTKEQRAFFKGHAPEGLELDDLSVLGPIFVLKLRYTPKGFNRRLVGEMWLYPDSTRIIELSTKCAPSETFDVAAEAQAFLSERGVNLEGEQQTKTRTALEFFSGQLKAASGPGYAGASGTRAGEARCSSAVAVSRAAAAARTAAGTASRPAVPVSKAAKTIDESSSRLMAAMPAAAPAAIAQVGETSNQITASVARPMPRKIAGKMKPPRKPQPRQTAKARAFAARRTKTIDVESSATRVGTEAWPEKSTS
jgi:hypothetical protein